MCQITKVHFVHRKTIRYNNDHSLVLLQLFPKIVHKQLSEECTFEKYHINHGDENIEIFLFIELLDYETLNLFTASNI